MQKARCPVGSQRTFQTRTRSGCPGWQQGRHREPEVKRWALPWTYLSTSDHTERRSHLTGLQAQLPEATARCASGLTSDAFLHAQEMGPRIHKASHRSKHRHVDLHLGVLDSTGDILTTVPSFTLGVTGTDIKPPRPEPWPRHFRTPRQVPSPLDPRKSQYLSQGAVGGREEAGDGPA